LSLQLGRRPISRPATAGEKQPIDELHTARVAIKQANSTSKADALLKRTVANTLRPIHRHLHFKNLDPNPLRNKSAACEGLVKGKQHLIKIRINLVVCALASETLDKT